VTSEAIEGGLGDWGRGRVGHVIYLHGFASSPSSSKARFFAARLAPRGVPFRCPDFNVPDFSTLTVTRMVEDVEAALAALGPEPVTLIGSSLGGFVAWHVAARAEGRGRPMERLILLAPALDFGANRMKDIGDAGLEEWRATGWREFFHHTYGEPRRVHYDLYADAQRHDASVARVSAPVLVFQGRRDVAVDATVVEAFARARANCELHLLDDDHQLLGSLEYIWRESARFLGLEP
jgi:uncharacterized protein